MIGICVVLGLSLGLSRLVNWTLKWIFGSSSCFFWEVRALGKHFRLGGVPAGRAERLHKLCFASETEGLRHTKTLENHH